MSGNGHRGSTRVDALQGPPVDPHQALRLEPGGVGMEAEVDHRFERGAGHRRGTSTENRNQVVPHGRLQWPPMANGR